MAVLPADVPAGGLLGRVASLVKPKLGRVRKLPPTVLAGDSGGQLVSRQPLAMFPDDVVLQETVLFPTDGAELPLTAVHHPVAAQVFRLREAPSAGVTPVGSHVPVHQLVSRQVTEMVKAPPTHVTNEGLVGVCQPVGLQHAGAGVTFPTDVTVAGLLTSVVHLHMQVTVSLVVEALGAVITGKRQHPVHFYLVLAELQHASENRPAH